MDVWDPALAAHRAKIIRVGVAATFLTLAAFLAFRLLPGGDAIPGHIFVPLWSLAAIAGLLAMVAPWDRLFSTSAGRRLLYLWSVVDIGLITALIAWVPEEDPIFFLSYVLTTIFFSLLYPRRSQMGLFLLTASSYTAVYLAGETSATLAQFVLRLGLLGAVTVLAGFSSNELMRGVLEATKHRTRSEREKALYETLATAQSDLGEGVSIADLSTQRIVYVNDAFCRIYGYSREELTSMSFMDLLAPEHKEVAEALRRERIAGDGTAEYDRDFFGVRKDGTSVIVDTVSKPLPDGSVISVVRDVTDARRAEQELRGREELFRAVSELTSDFVYSMRIGPNGQQAWEWVTDGFKSVTGYDVDDPAVHAGWDALVHPDHRETSTALYRDLLSSRGRVRHELSICTRSGERRWMEVSAEAVTDASKGRVTRIFGTAQDVTEKRAGAAAERERAELHQAVSELTSDYVYAVTVDGSGDLEWLWVTDGFSHVTGYTPDELEDEGWATLFHPDDLQRAQEVLAELMLGRGGSIVFEHRILTKDRVVKHVRTHASSSRTQDGNLRIHGAVQDISERVAAEEALRASERRYRTLFDRLPIGMFVRHFDGAGIDANPACVEMFGYPDRHAFISAHASELYVDPSARERFLTVMNADQEAVVETEFRRFDGSTFWGLIHARAVRDVNGDLVLLEGAISDVTEQRAARRELQHSVSLLRSTLESTLDGVLVFRLDGGIVTYNRQFLDMWQIPEEVIERRRSEDVIEAVLPLVKDPQAFKEGVETIFLEPHRETFDVIELLDGRVFERYSRPHRDDRLVGRVVSYRDVTERRRSARRLEESLALLRATLESVGEGILVLGEKGEIAAFNKRFCEIWDIPEELLAGDDRAAVTEMAASRVKDKDAFLASIERNDSGVTEDQVESIELRDGRILERFTRGASDRGIGRVVSFRDITQRRALEEQLRQAQKMEALGRLAGGIAHDFNNLLTAILGYSELLRGAPGLSEEVRSDIEEIDVAAQMGADITAQLLDLSRRRVLRQEVLDVNDVVVTMEPMLTRLIGGDIVLDVQVAEDDCRVEADRSQVEQILLNLVVNARDALPNGGGVSISTKTVELSAEQASKGLRLAPGPHVLLTVSDNGPGIDPEVRDRIFEPFFTTHGGGNTGLGLSTVYGIVSQYNGHIAVESNRGVGTSFRVYLPAAAQEPIPLARHRAAERWLSGTETVLLVEDDDAIRRLAKRALESYGYSVLEAANSAEALALPQLVSGDVHLLLTDVVMPGLGGRELGRKVIELNPRTKVLYISGYTGEALAQFGELGWNEDFLAKPFRPEALAVKVREILNREEPHSASR